MTARRRVLLGAATALAGGGLAVAQGTRPRIGLVIAGRRNAERVAGELPQDLMAAGIRDADLDVVGGAPEELPTLARALVARAPRLIFTGGPAAIVAVRDATADIPQIMIGPDPVALGLADSLARPRGNVTGIVLVQGELDAKRLELLTELAPRARRLVVLVPEGAPLDPARERMLVQAARGLDRELVTETLSRQTAAAAFARMPGAGVGAIVVTGDPGLTDMAAELARLAREHRLPSACQWREMVVDGLMLGYGHSRRDAWRRVAEMAAMVLRGVSPREIPLERPARFELVLNAATARAVGVEIPPLMLARADEVIE